MVVIDKSKPVKESDSEAKNCSDTKNRADAKNRADKKNRSNAINRSKQSRAAAYDSKRRDLRRVIEKVQQQQQHKNRNNPRRTSFIANPPQSSHKPAQRKSLVTRVKQPVTNPLKSYRIQKLPIQICIPNKVTPIKTTPDSIATQLPPSSTAVAAEQKTFVSIGVQTEPCKCQLRNQTKNRNRRNAAKSAKASQANQNSK